jgi:hypothetical protein
VKRTIGLSFLLATLLYGSSAWSITQPECPPVCRGTGQGENTFAEILFFGDLNHDIFQLSSPFFLDQSLSDGSGNGRGIVDLATGSLRAVSTGASGSTGFTVISVGGDLYALGGLAPGTSITVQATLTAQGTGLITESSRSGGAMVQIQRGSGGAPSDFDRQVFQAPGNAPLNSPFSITLDASISFSALIGEAFPLVYFLRLDTSSGTTFDFLSTATLSFNLPQGVTISSVGGFTNAIAAANAGPDQTVNEVDLVTLDGSGSTGAQLTYQWTQVAGPAVSLNLSDPVHPTFTAPEVSVGGATLTFQLIVSSGQQTSNPDTVDINVMNVNHAPVADAGVDQTVQEGSLVTLDGSGSFDPDREPITYQWVQTAGPAVTLSSSTVVNPSFTAPLVGIGGATLTFQLTVDDGRAASVPDPVNVSVQNVNHPPTANAGPDQTVNENALVTLNGTASSDPDNDPLTYQWTQVSGPAVTLSDPTNASPTFTAPLVAPGGATLVFQLVVHDGQVASAPATVTITVLNVNDPPACSLAQPSPASLWPPGHALVPVTIVGVSDPNNDQITITVTGVTQDEPVSGLGDGDTSPDAVLQGSTALLRAERSGTGNGRVYEVQFAANDGQGGSCIAAVKIQVPHDKRGTAIDDGQLYDSTLP